MRYGRDHRARLHRRLSGDAVRAYDGGVYAGRCAHDVWLVGARSSRYVCGSCEDGT